MPNLFGNWKITTHGKDSHLRMILGKIWKIDVPVLVTQYAKKQKKINQKLAEEINKFVDQKS
jgi:hypothetical protein